MSLDQTSQPVSGRPWFKMHPAALLGLSFLAAIAAGAVLLALPIATRTGSIGFVDALFTATSAVCVTGLIVVDTGSYFTTFGQVVILILIQVGGLGVMTISVALFNLIGRDISFKNRMLMQDLLSHKPRQDIYGLVWTVILFSLLSELVGAALLFPGFIADYPVGEAIYQSVFHSVSAFCNAGFSLFSDSLVRYNDSLLITGTLSLLIVVGGIGFPVVYNLYCWSRDKSVRRPKLAVQTKTVLVTSAVLIVIGAVLFGVLEWNIIAEESSWFKRLLIPLFQSITCRTAGFNSVDIGSLSEATLAMMMFLMFFGASPGSCGGGVKTTTLAVLAVFTVSRIYHKKRVNMFHKSIPQETVTRSISLIVLSLAIIGLVLFVVLIGNASDAPGVQDHHNPFLAYLFETVSAFGTVGLSMGVTADLNGFGKIMIMLLMLIGRLGVLSFSYIIVGAAGVLRGKVYSEENVMIG
ncbi:MAG TPA: TrkH family potassium uptake protein [candidate division Zixibacteria bacterium]|nr:TrkH family potassium uptake protein [candidate division Zixibacteria bacterium]